MEFKVCHLGSVSSPYKRVLSTDERHVGGEVEDEYESEKRPKGW